MAGTPNFNCGAVGAQVRAGLRQARTSIANFGTLVKESSKDVGHAAMNFAGAYPNVSLDSPQHEQWLNPRVRYLGTTPGQTGQTLSNSGLPFCKKLVFVISAGLLAISIGAPLSYFKNLSLTAAHDFKKHLQFALGSSCLESCFNLTQDHRTIFHQYFAAPLIAAVILLPFYFKHILTNYLTRNVLISLIGGPLAPSILSAVLIAGGLKTSLAVGAQIKYQIKSYYHWATERNCQTSPHKAPELNSVYFWFTAALAAPISGLGIFGIAQWHEFKYTLQDAQSYLNPSHLSADLKAGHISHQTKKYLRLLGVLGMATAGLLSIFILGQAYLAETLCIQTLRIFSWLYPLIKQDQSEPPRTNQPSESKRPSWLVNAAKPIAYAINGTGAFFINNFYCAAWTISYFSQAPFRNGESFLPHPPRNSWGEVARYLTGLPGYIAGSFIAFAFVHQWTMGSDLTSKAYGYSCGSTQPADTAPSADSGMHPFCSVSGAFIRILGLPGLTIGAALSIPALLYFVTKNFCAGILWISTQIIQGIQAVFQAAASQISQYHHWSTQKDVPAFPQHSSEHSPMAHIIASPFSGLAIGAMAQWYAAKHTLQDAHQTFSPNTPLKDIGHIATQSKKYLRALGALGYATGALLSIFPLGYAFLNEVLYIQTPEMLSWLHGLISAQETPTTQTSSRIQRPDYVRFPAWLTAGLMSFPSAFFINNFYCAVWTFKHLNTAPFKKIQLDSRLSHPSFKYPEIARYVTGLPGYGIGLSLAGVVHQFVTMGDVAQKIYKKAGCCGEQTADQTTTPGEPSSCGIYPVCSIPGLVSRGLGIFGVAVGTAISMPALAYFTAVKTSLAIRAVFQAAVQHMSIYQHWATNRQNSLIAATLSPAEPTNHTPLLATEDGKHTTEEAKVATSPAITPTHTSCTPKKKTHFCFTHLIASPFSGTAIFLMAQWYGFKYLSQDIFNYFSPNLALENTGHIQNQYYKILRSLSAPIGYPLSFLTIAPSLLIAYLDELFRVQVPEYTRWLLGLISPNYQVVQASGLQRSERFKTAVSSILFAPFIISAALGLIINNAYCAYWAINKLTDLPFAISLLKPEHLHPEFKVREIVRYVLGSPGYLLGLGLAGLWHQWTMFSDTVQKSYGCDISQDTQLHPLSSLAGFVSCFLGLPGIILGLIISSPVFVYHAIGSTLRTTKDTWSEAYQWIRSRPDALPIHTAKALTDPSVSQCLTYIPYLWTGIPALMIGSFLNATQASASFLFNQSNLQDLAPRKSLQHLAGALSFGYALAVIPGLLMIPFALMYQTYQHRKILKDIAMTTGYLMLSTALMSAWKLSLKPMKSLIIGPTWINRFASIISLIGLAAGVFAGIHIHTPASLALLPVLGGALGMTFRTCVKHCFDFKTRFANQDQNPTTNPLHAYDLAFGSLFNAFSVGDKIPDLAVSNLASESASESASSAPAPVFNQSLCTKIMRNLIQIPTGLAHQSTDKNLAKGLHNGWLAWKKDSQAAQSPSMAMSVFVNTPLFKNNLDRVRATYSHTKPQEQAGFLARVDNTLDTLAFYMGLDNPSSAPSAPPYGSEQFRSDIKGVITGVEMAA